MSTAVGERPLVSAIVPVHNGERFLREALESIVNQGYEPLELIVVDDASTDGSVAIAQEFPVRLLRQPNRGVAAARNAGLHAARGEVIAFLDQDDRWTPGKLDAQVSQLVTRPQLGYVLGWLRVVLEPGVELPEWAPPDQAGFNMGALVARRRLFDELGGFDETYRAASDADWFARAKDARIPRLILRRVVLEYRIHEGNASYEQATSKLELMRVLKGTIERQRRKAGRDA